jgi:hypothetical protein
MVAFGAGFVVARATAGADVCAGVVALAGRRVWAGAAVFGAGVGGGTEEVAAGEDVAPGASFTTESVVCLHAAPSRHRTAAATSA